MNYTSELQMKERTNERRYSQSSREQKRLDTEIIIHLREVAREVKVVM